MTPMTHRGRMRRAEARQAGPARNRERGAVAVEAALITPIFILVVFAILEFGLLFKDWLAVSSSVRAGVRIASAEPRVSTFAADAAANVAREAGALQMADVQELWIYRAEADGSPVGDNAGDFSACSNDCVKYKWDGTAFTLVSDKWPATSHNACQGDANRHDVGVYLKYKHPSVTKFIFDSMMIRDHAVMTFEPIPATRGCKA